VTQLLPTSVKPRTDVNPSTAHIEIYNPTAAQHAYIKTEYAYIRDYCRRLHDDHGHLYDLFVHIGQASGWDFVSIERLAFKQGMSSNWWTAREREAYYMIPDNAGKTVEDAGRCPWDGVPMALQTCLDVDKIAAGANSILETGYRFGEPFSSAAATDRAIYQAAGGDRANSQAHLSPIKVKPHNEGGPYCCGFIHYESLANCYVQGRPGVVLFCHVPEQLDIESLQRARDAILAVIVSAVNELIQRRDENTKGQEAGVHP